MTLLFRYVDKKDNSSRVKIFIGLKHKNKPLINNNN